MKILKVTAILIVIFAVGLYTYNLLDSPEATEDNEMQDGFDTIEDNEATKIEEVNDTEDEEPMIGNVPSTEEVAIEFPDNMMESEIQDAIHHMSHQKVEASQKWGKMRITDERIERLIEVVENKQEGHLDNKDVYLDILERWNQGDFTRAVEDHNAIWELQGGTVGIATGLLSDEAEQQYIELHFSE
ncbi:DUF6241 domain-containing protein [Salipaludibacillus sp. HK11]|uniref:DUF6241 domain-containing protein n=1 Tax=Salipaludibacillus sp. HK11 TaxID=3394320 RepID=UPI0039FCB14E